MAPIGKNRQSVGVPRGIKSGSFDTTIAGEKPPTTLKLWIIKLTSGGILVEGYRAVSENDATTLQNWRSTPIAKRIDGKTLETHSGSIYKLKGCIDEDEAAEAGIPEELIEEFARGFPENWEELVQPHLDKLREIRRRQSIDTTTRMEEEETKGSKKKNGILPLDDIIDTEMGEDDERLKEAKKRRSMQKGRKSMMQRVQPASPIEEEEEEEKTPPRRKTPARGKKTSETPMESKKTPIGRGRRMEGKEENEDEVIEVMEEKEHPLPNATTSRASRTPKIANEKKKTPKRMEEKEEEEVFATPEENPRLKNTSKDLSLIGIPDKRQEAPTNLRRVSLEDMPKEIKEKSIPLSKWVIRFVRGGTNTSIFPHFQFKICGFRNENDEQEWNTSVIIKVVYPYLMFTSSSIYRLDGPMDVDQSTEMGFPPQFITDFLMGFPDDWEERLETFFNKTFGPPPQPKIVELMSDGGTVDERKKEERNQEQGKNNEKEKEKEKERKRKSENDFDTPRNSDGQKIRVKGLKLVYDKMNETPIGNRKRKEPTPSSSSSSSGEESDSDEEEQLRREARKVEREIRREELRAQKEAELRAKAKEEKKKRFEVKVNRTPNGVPVSRSGRTLRTPMATWAGENITYDASGNVVDMTGVTTTTKLTVGKTNANQSAMLAAHYGMDSPLNGFCQQERAIAPPSACLPKTPAPKKSKADLKGYSDDEVIKEMFFEQYMAMRASQGDSTPAFNLKKGKRRLRAVESSDSEAEAEKRKIEKKKQRKEERRRLRESEEEEDSSDDGWRRKKSKSKKKVTVKKEKKPVKAVAGSSKKRKEKKEESEDEEEEFDLEIEHDEDAVTFNPSEDGSIGGNGYSDDDLIEIEGEGARKKEKKKPVKRAKAWKQEEVLRLKLAIQAAGEAFRSENGWEIVAKSLGGERSVEECRKAARERLYMKVDEPRHMESEGELEGASEKGWSGGESGEASEDDDKKKRRKEKMGNENRMKGVTANKGTIQFAVEMENKKRELIMGGTSSQDDYFKSSQGKKISETVALPSVAQFDPDDSLLECLDDADLTPAPKQRTTKTAKAAAESFSTPRLSSYEDSPASSLRRSARRSSTLYIPSPVIDQNNLTKYVHQLSRAKNVSMMSKSMATDRSRMLPPALPKGRNVARAANAIERVENSLRNQKRRDDTLGDLEEDEENENNIFPPGF